MLTMLMMIMSFGLQMRLENGCCWTLETFQTLYIQSVCVVTFNLRWRQTTLLLYSIGLRLDSLRLYRRLCTCIIYIVGKYSWEKYSSNSAVLLYWCEMWTGLVVQSIYTPQQLWYQSCTLRFYSFRILATVYNILLFIILKDMTI